MEYLISAALFFAGVFLLVKGGDAFVDCSLWFARRFRLSEVVIGATIVSVGTTLPELVVSVTASVNGYAGIAYGNAIGSVIFNTGFIAGLVLLCAPPEVRRRDFFEGTAFFFTAAGIYFASAYFLGGIPRGVALVLLGILICYILRIIRLGGSGGAQPQQIEGKMSVQIVGLLIGTVAIYTGSHLMVDNAVKFANWFGVSEQVIALTVIACGTSLPELATAVIAIRKGHGALSLGNLLGANFLNIVSVSALSSLVMPMVVDANAVSTDLIVMLLAMMVFTLPLVSRKKGSRLQGLFLIALYLLYISALFT